jgi:hypothetical protein
MRSPPTVSFSPSLNLVGVVENQCVVAPLSALTIKELTLTGSKSARMTFVKQERSSSFQRLSGVPINPPVSPLSARMIP